MVCQDVAERFAGDGAWMRRRPGWYALWMGCAIVVAAEGSGRVMKRRFGANALLWAYAASVAGFYALVARRTGSAGVRALPTAEEAHGSEAAAALPRVTIVVPARDEERNIRACVESLLTQDYPNFAVIVVDDASTDATPAILDDIRRNHPQGALLEVTRVEQIGRASCRERV